MKQFKNCPKQYYEQRVARTVKHKDTEQTLWGDRVHKDLETALTTGEKPSIEVLEPVADLFRGIKGNFQAEQKLALTQSLQPTAWFAPDVWCRAILDALWVDGDKAKIADWKTGKRKMDAEQLKLFALFVFAYHRQVDVVNTGFVWLQTGQMDVEKYHRKDIPILWQDLLPDVRRLELAHNTNTFPPRPSGLCAWCPVKSCSFWRSDDGTGGQKR